MKNLTITVTGIIILLFSLTVTAKDNKKEKKPGCLEVFGKVKKANDNLDGVTLTVSSEGSSPEEFQLGAKGKFDVRLQLNKIYTMKFSKLGIATKTIQLNTEVPDSSLAYDEYEYKFNVNLAVDNHQSKHTQLSNIPAAKIAYVDRYDGFDYDHKYDRSLHSGHIALLKSQEATSLASKTK